jgi:Flp pilus assembly protein TadG
MLQAGKGLVRAMRLREKLAAFRRSEGGNILMTFALSITVLAGAAGLGTEVASWYSTRRTMQNAADLGAAGGALFLKTYFANASSTYDGYAKNEAKSATAYHGFVSGTNGTTVTVNIPPVSGSYTGAAYDHIAVEVVVSQPAPLAFAGLFLPQGPTISARAVGLVNVPNGDCLYALNPTAAQAFSLSGTGTVNIDCGIAVDSNATANNCNNANNAKNASTYINGNATVTATSLTTRGNDCVSGSGSFSSPDTQTGTNPPANPYSTNWGTSASALTPPTGTPNQGGFSDSPSSTNTLQPGIYSSISITGTATLTAGTYFVEGGNVSLTGTVTGTGVTIVLTGTSPGSSSVGTMTLGASNASISLTAPTSGTYAGMAIVQDPNAAQDTFNGGGNCQTNCNFMQGGPNTNITGVVYFPQGNLSFSGTPNLASSGCLQLLADTLAWAGTPSLLVNGCGGTGVTPFGPIVAELVE